MPITKTAITDYTNVSVGDVVELESRPGQQWKIIGIKYSSQASCAALDLRNMLLNSRGIAEAISVSTSPNAKKVYSIERIHQTPRTGRRAVRL